MADDEFDRRPWLRKQPSYGADWDAAIEFGIDVSMIEENLQLSYEERFRESVRLTRFAKTLEAARERLHGSGE
jgi:hypothetical protein